MRAPPPPPARRPGLQRLPSAFGLLSWRGKLRRGKAEAGQSFQLLQGLRPAASRDRPAWPELKEKQEQALRDYDSRHAPRGGLAPLAGGRGRWLPGNAYGRRLREALHGRLRAGKPPTVGAAPRGQPRPQQRQPGQHDGERKAFPARPLAFPARLRNRRRPECTARGARRGVAQARA